MTALCSGLFFEGDKAGDETWVRRQF